MISRGLVGVVLFFSVFISVPVALAGESAFVLKSCEPNMPILNDASFVMKFGDDITFKCTVLNTGSDTAGIRVFGSRTSESGMNGKTFSTSIPVEGVSAGESAEAVIPFAPVFEGDTYRYDISLMGIGSDGKLGETIGTPISFTGKVDASTVKIMSALLDRSSYKEGDTAILSLGLTSTEKASKNLSVNIALKRAEGSVCSYVSVGNPLGLGQYPFHFLSGGVPCDVSAIEVSLVNNKDGSTVDTITVQISPMMLKESVQNGSVPAETKILNNLSMREIAMTIVGVLVFLSVVVIVFFRQKRTTVMKMLLWLFLPMMFLFSVPFANAGASCSYSGPVNWGSCGTNYSGTIPDGGGGALYNSYPGYNGFMYVSCNNGSWVIGGMSCAPIDTACVFNGYVGWGSCGTFFWGSVPSGSSKTLTNANTGYAGSATFSCNNTVWSKGAESCTPVVSSCSFSGYVPWGSGCGTNANATVANGFVGTISNTNAGHSGSATYLCNNGTFSETGSSCDTVGKSCSFSSSVVWDSCYNNQSITKQDGESVTMPNENGGYTGSATYSCNNGTWSVGVKSCNLLVGPGPVAVNGVCGATHYNCNAGTLGTTVEYATQWQWQCVGSGGGSTASCSENKIVAPSAPALTFTANPTSIANGGSSVLNWSTNAASCFASDGWTGWKTVGNNISAVVSPVVDTTYTLECWSSVGVSSGPRSATVIIAPTLTFVANPTSVSSGGGSTLTWNTTNAVSCTASGDWSGTKAMPGGTQTQVNITADKTYTLVCQNNVGTTVSRTVTVTVTAGPLCTPDCSTARTDKVCSGQSLSDTCSGTCTGTRLCDYNWKEVAP